MQAAAQKVKAANEALGLAVQAAGAPPKSVEPKVMRCSTGSRPSTRSSPEILARCNGADPKCQNFVTEYGKNNRDTIVPALDALAART